MAEKDVLSQEEIDALLDSVDETEEAEADTPKAKTAKGKTTTKKAKQDKDPESDKSAEPTVEAESEEIKTISFTSQERIVKGHLPVLDKIYDRAMRLFVTDIYQLTAKDFEIKQEPLLIVKHREFMKTLPNPSLMSMYKFKPLRGKGIILFDSVFVYDLVDYYFGGNSQFFAQKDKTDFTATERKVMDEVIKKLINKLIHSWESIMLLEPMRVGEETNPQLVTIAEPDEMLVVAHFSIDFGKESGSFYIILPYSMVEPIKQLLELGAARPDDEIDPNWINSLKEELMDVELTVSASMAQTQSSLGAIMEWKEGDFIPLEISKEVTLDLEGTPSYTGTLGSANEKRALKINKIISY